MHKYSKTWLSSHLSMLVASVHNTCGGMHFFLRLALFFSPNLRRFEVFMCVLFIVCLRLAASYFAIIWNDRQLNKALVFQWMAAKGKVYSISIIQLKLYFQEMNRKKIEKIFVK